MENKKNIIAAEPLNASEFRAVPNFHTGNGLPFINIVLNGTEIATNVDDAANAARDIFRAIGDAEMFAAVYRHCREDAGMNHDEAGAVVMKVREKIWKVREADFNRRQTKVQHVAANQGVFPA